MSRKRYLVNLAYRKWFIYETEDLGDCIYTLEGECSDTIEGAFNEFFSSRICTHNAYDAAWKFYNITDLNSLEEIKKLVLADKLSK